MFSGMRILRYLGKISKEQMAAVDDAALESLGIVFPECKAYILKGEFNQGIHFGEQVQRECSVLFRSPAYRA